MPLKQTFDTFRQPEYVGENRCLPCTVVNLAIALVAAGASIALFEAGGAPRSASLSAGALIFLSSVAIVYFRGYLVPGTPTITKRYLPARVLRLFGKTVRSGRDEAENVDTETVLLKAGALKPCDDRDDLCLIPSFRTAWYDRIDTFAETDPGLGGLLERGDLAGTARRSGVTFDRQGDAYVASVDDTQIAQWASWAAYIADAAAAAELQNRYAGWHAMTFRERTDIAGALRLWVERCPACGGTVEMGKETVESCCRERTVLASSCAKCGSRVFEADIEAAGLAD